MFTDASATQCAGGKASIAHNRPKNFGLPVSCFDESSVHATLGIVHGLAQLKMIGASFQVDRSEYIRIHIANLMNPICFR